MREKNKRKVFLEVASFKKQVKYRSRTASKAGFHSRSKNSVKDIIMETILRGILSSSHPEQLKSMLLTKYLNSIYDSIQDNISASDCFGLFKLFIEWILTSENIDLRKNGHENLVKLAKAKPEYFREFITPNQIIEIFSNSTLNTNKAEIAPLIGEILDLLRFDEDFNNEDHLRGITNVAKAHLIHFLKDQG